MDVRSFAAVDRLLNQVVLWCCGGNDLSLDEAEESAAFSADPDNAGSITDQRGNAHALTGMQRVGLDLLPRAGSGVSPGNVAVGGDPYWSGGVSPQGGNVPSGQTVPFANRFPVAVLPQPEPLGRADPDTVTVVGAADHVDICVVQPGHRGRGVIVPEVEAGCRADPELAPRVVQRPYRSIQPCEQIPGGAIPNEDSAGCRASPELSARSPESQAIHTTLQIGAFCPRMPCAVIAADALVGPEPDFPIADSYGKNVVGGQAVFLGVVGPGRDQRPLRLDLGRPDKQHNGRGGQ